LFDGVHLSVVLDGHAIVPVDLAGEPLEQCDGFLAVIRLPGVSFNAHVLIVDVYGVADFPEFGERGAGIGGQFVKRVAVGVAIQIAGDVEKSARRQFGARETVAQDVDRVAECERGVHEPPASLPAILHPLRLPKLAVHRVHRIGEIRDRLANVAALEFPEHLVAMLDGGHLTQRLIEQLRHILVGIPLAHRCDDVAEP
jgi:hypothetical protein